MTIQGRSRQEPTYVVAHSPGMKIFGEGEWSVRPHRVGKRSTWCQLHLAVNEKTTKNIIGVNVKQRHLRTQKSIADNDVAMPGKEPGGPTLMPLSSTTPGASNFGRRAYRASICFMIRGGYPLCNDR
jgi:hypothetical protein